LSKPISLWNKTTLQLDAGAELQATDDPADFTKADNSDAGKSGSFIGFISGSNLTDIGITGKGTIDGAGARWWEPAIKTRQSDKNSTLARPRTIVLTGCKNVKISGVTLQNSPSFHLAPMDCQNVLIQDVTFKAPTNSPNTDGINLSQCRHVTIKQCIIDVGGENVAVKSSRPMSGREFASEDITVTNCTFGHGRGVSVGSETMGGVRNVSVKNCTFAGTDFGLHIKSSRNKGATAENIVCENLTMKDVRDAIVITCYNQGLPQGDTAQPVGEWTPIFQDIHFKNITASCYHSIGLIVGLPESEIKNVFLENVEISAAGTGLKVRNAKNIQLKNVHLWPKQGDPIIAEDNVEIQDLDKISTAAN
jgi:polygalacturonase